MMNGLKAYNFIKNNINTFGIVLTVIESEKPILDGFQVSAKTTCLKKHNLNKSNLAMTTNLTANDKDFVNSIGIIIF